jgi:cation transport ATPase
VWFVVWPPQNLVLAFSAVVAATLPTVAGVFPLWLAVLVHEGSTLLVGVGVITLAVQEAL